MCKRIVFHEDPIRLYEFFLLRVIPKYNALSEVKSLLLFPFRVMTYENCFLLFERGMVGKINEQTCSMTTPN